MVSTKVILPLAAQPNAEITLGHKEPMMHIQIVTFTLKNLADAEFHTLCDQLAPAFTVLPGLLSKVWLADPATNTYGGVYTWKSRAAMEAYMQSELFDDVVSHPKFTNVTSKDFSILVEPTRVTHGLIEAAA
jgi:quinol monooxygenase YgiN